MRNYVGVALIKENMVVAQTRDNDPKIKNPGKICIPGGVAEWHDFNNLNVAALRELWEETRYLLPLSVVLFGLPLLHSDEIEVNGSSVKRCIFWAEHDGKQQIQCKEGAGMGFLSRTQITKESVAPNFGIIFDKAFDIAESLGSR